jgi:hypothetical protein
VALDGDRRAAVLEVQAMTYAGTWARAGDPVVFSPRALEATVEALTAATLRLQADTDTATPNAHHSDALLADIGY